MCLMQKICLGHPIYDLNMIVYSILLHLRFGWCFILYRLDEMSGDEDESGSTATVMLIGNDMLFISHVGDSCVVCIQS